MLAYLNEHYFNPTSRLMLVLFLYSAFCCIHPSLSFFLALCLSLPLSHPPSLLEAVA